MKNRQYLLFLLLICVIFGSACAREVDPARYRAEGFCAELMGSLQGVDFGARVTGDALGGTIEFVTPISLSGVRVEWREEHCRVTRNGVTFELSIEAVSGWLAPLRLLLLEETPKTVCCEGEETILTFPSGGELTLSEEGVPLGGTGEGFSFTVCRWVSNGG